MFQEDAQPPPQCMRTDEYSAADLARLRLTRKPRFPLFASLPNLRQSAKGIGSSGSGSGSGSVSRLKPSKRARNREEVSGPSSSEPSFIPRLEGSNEFKTIKLDRAAINDEAEDKDVFRWAILYENQRGVTVFSTAYYSPLTLLPNDPAPFTIPSSSSSDNNQPYVSLTEYPLPDANWCWVSKSWMIDMRSDTGEVQHDGFEYNWMFRKANWRAEVGHFSAGGWVRRRRWVRLMMRPAKVPKTYTLGENIGDSSPRIGGSVAEGITNRQSIVSSLVSSLHSTDRALVDDPFAVDPREIWQGHDAKEDWARCHALMRRLGRDGRKLELWKAWLAGHYEESKAFGKTRQQWTEDEMPMPSEKTSEHVPTHPSPSLEHIVAVLRFHGDAVLHSFIYPDSRAQFIAILGKAGILSELNVGLGMGFNASEVDFWSYQSGIGDMASAGLRADFAKEELGQISTISGEFSGVQEARRADEADGLRKAIPAIDHRVQEDS